MPEFESNLQQPGWRASPPARTFQPNPFPDEVLETETITLPRKRFTVSRRRNRGGEFLRIEEVRVIQGVEKRHAVLVPAEFGDEFLRVFQRLWEKCAA